jgi:hypothetical protein
VLRKAELSREADSELPRRLLAARLRLSSVAQAVPVRRLREPVYWHTPGVKRWGKKSEIRHPLPWEKCEARAPKKPIQYCLSGARL